MTRFSMILGSLLLVLSPSVAHAVPRGSATPSLCAGTTWSWCPNKGGEGDARSGALFAFHRSASTTRQSKWIAARLGKDNTRAFHAVPSGTATSAADLRNSAEANSSRLDHFAPGQSTAEGQHIVEWTLLAAPLAAYALSPAIDHRLHYESSGIWTRQYQLDFEHLVMLTELGGAFWYGGQSRIGRTFWRSVDASIFTAVTTTAMKYAFSRARPRQSKSPDRWFQGNCCQSFPSGEVSYQASFVTPFIAEYHKDYPWVWALEVLPAYDAVARMKTHGHWQTDVLAAWAIGTAWGLYAHDEHHPLILSFMPHGVMVGLHVHF